MKYTIKYLSILIISMSFLISTACTPNTPNTPNKTIEQENIIQGNSGLDISYEHYKYFIDSNDLSINFTIAYLNHDIDSMKNILPDDSNIIIGEDNITFENNEKILFYIDKEISIYPKINSFGYNEEKQCMIIQIFLEDIENSKSYGFLNFNMKKINNCWNIIDIDRDI